VTVVAQRPTPARELAFQVVRDVFGPDARAAQGSFDAHLRRSRLDSRDVAFAAELAYGTIEQRRLLDWYIAPYLADRAKALPPAIAEILRLGVYQIAMMSGVDAHAAVHETVNLALRHGHRGTAGLVNAILRRLIVDAPAPPDRSGFKSEADYLGTRYSLPTWIVTQLGQTFGEQLEAILSGLNRAPQRAVRVNRLRATVDEAIWALAANGVRTRRSERVEEVLVVEAGIASDDAQGRWSVQSESASIPAAILDPKPGENVLDLCAGRGNKSIQIAARMNNEGALYCVEIDARKIGTLTADLERSGVECAALVSGDVRTADLPFADAVLLDAPCSGIGIIGRHPEARWRKSPDDGARLAALQGELLEAAARRVKAGGRLVYSVCSTDRREGIDLAEAFLAANREFRSHGEDVLIAPGIDGRDGFYVASFLYVG
jgi:16S rRNA (cytosine967-C5)-methyltransferase